MFSAMTLMPTSNEVVPRVVDGGEKGDKLADMDRLTEGNLVYGQRDDAQDIGLRRRRQPDPSASGWCRHADCRQSLPCPESLISTVIASWWQGRFIVSNFLDQ
jgi:hypothetical protein